MTRPRFINLRDGGNMRPARPGLIREAVKLAIIVGFVVAFYVVTP